MKTNKKSYSLAWSKVYKVNYWRLGFKTRLYDLLTPQAYRESARRLIRSLSIKKGQVLLDAGCGTGLMIDFLRNPPGFGLRYIGTDILLPGLKRARGKLQKGDHGNTLFFQGDLTCPLPIKMESLDIIVAHFSLYTIVDQEIRKRVLSHLVQSLKPNGVIAIVNPSRGYNANRIISESVEALREQRGALIAWAKKWFLYPFTYHLGLKFIEEQLKLKKFKAYSFDEICQEVEEAGLSVVHTESLYADSAYLVTARRTPLIKS